MYEEASPPAGGSAARVEIEADKGGTAGAVAVIGT
jgi:hypothetical protein